MILDLQCPAKLLNPQSPRGLIHLLICSWSMVTAASFVLADKYSQRVGGIKCAEVCLLTKSLNLSRPGVVQLQKTDFPPFSVQFVGRSYLKSGTII